MVLNQHRFYYKNSLCPFIQKFLSEISVCNKMQGNNMSVHKAYVTHTTAFSSKHQVLTFWSQLQQSQGLLVLTYRVPGIRSGKIICRFTVAILSRFVCTCIWVAILIECLNSYKQLGSNAWLTSVKIGLRNITQIYVTPYAKHECSVAAISPY